MKRRTADERPPMGKLEALIIAAHVRRGESDATPDEIAEAERVLGRAIRPITPGGAA